MVKNSDTLLEFVFITGISKFAKVSLFSHLNHLNDITLAPQYAALAGYTQAELEYYFADHLQACLESQKKMPSPLMEGQNGVVFKNLIEN